MSGQRNKPAVSMAEIRPELARLRRRGFLRNMLSLGSLTMLTGCDLSTHSGVDGALEAIERFDDRVQAALFNPHRLAETYPASAITHPFRFNAYYAVARHDGWPVSDRQMAGHCAEPRWPYWRSATRRNVTAGARII